MSLAKQIKEKKMIDRLQKYMAHCGVASRRKAEEIILEGRVKVNSEIIKELGYKVDTEVDQVYVDDKLIKFESRKVYVALNKPVGYVCTVKDEKNRKTILDLVNVEERIYPIGRLDYNSSGLILLTNDGDIYNKIIHPRKKIEKTYIVLIKGIPSANNINKFKNGVDIGGYVTQKSQFQIIKELSNGNSRVKIVITEGKNRQIRKMCEVIGHPVLELQRISVGEIQLGALGLGEWRNLTLNELNYINNI
jgi:23S rRNA pseudouridine2605 synthase